MIALLRLIGILCALLQLQACFVPDNNTEAAAYNLQLGIEYLKQKDFPRAKRKLVSALTLAPKSAEAQCAMGYFFLKTGDLQNAGKYYRKALSLGSDKGAILNNYGTFLCQTGHNREALQYFLKATQDMHYMNTAAAFENAGLCAKAIPDAALAKRFFRQALRQDPKRRQSLYELIRQTKNEHYNRH